MPTRGQNKIPPDITAITRTLTSDLLPAPRTRCWNRANSEKDGGNGQQLFAEWADLCKSSWNRRIRMRKNRQISINARTVKTASSISNISCTSRPASEKRKANDKNLTPADQLSVGFIK